ncbi:MAG: V-type ATP synthase subunit F [Thermovirgaceae bacterium]|nr:V-type ATP synthase subunit F [Synergistales bacterium]HPC75081.1 V-type ATP synthase subunit F [Synergistales bacterium]HRS48447.1 V-type ATP synthase subunit F [Thermovirgaceae bacterium]HRU90323.1 V-type ATP synthase subunit F [Thermovirgaceae bacterium]
MSDGKNLLMAAVGDFESVLPFQAVGVSPFSPENGLRELLLGLAKEQYAVVFLVDSLYRDNREMVEELNEHYAMSIIPVPGIRGSTGIGISTIRESVERAVGMDIFSVK